MSSLQHSSDRKKRKDVGDGSLSSAARKTRVEQLEQELMELRMELSETKGKLSEALKRLESKDGSDDDDADDDSVTSNHDDPWMIKYNDLREFRIMNGHCKIPSTAGPQRKLCFWVKDQKKAKKAGKLSPERIAKLESIGLVWSKDAPPPLTWEQHFEELEKYRKAFGNCYVRIDPNKTSPLAKWISVQRYEYKRFKKQTGSLLSLDQIKALRDIGFKWTGPRL